MLTSVFHEDLEKLQEMLVIACASEAIDCVKILLGLNAPIDRDAGALLEVFFPSFQFLFMNCMNMFVFSLFSVCFFFPLRKLPRYSAVVFHTFEQYCRAVRQQAISSEKFHLSCFFTE